MVFIKTSQPASNRTTAVKGLSYLSTLIAFFARVDAASVSKVNQMKLERKLRFPDQSSVAKTTSICSIRLISPLVVD